MEKKDRAIQRQRQTPGAVAVRTRHTKGSQNTLRKSLEIRRVPSGFRFFCLWFFSPLLLGHMLLTRFSAQEKRKSTEQWRWGTGARKSAGRGGKVVKPQDHTREQPARITRRMRGNTLSLEGEWGRSAVRTSAGWGICGRVLTCGRHGERRD